MHKSLLLIFLISCGSVPDQQSFDMTEKVYIAGRKFGIHKIARPKPSIHNDLKWVIDEFITETGYNIGDLSVKVKGSDPSCINYLLLGYKEIHFPRYMLDMPNEYIKIIMYHELGHCVLKKFHTDCTVLDIMCAELSNYELDFIHMHWEYYLNRLLQ